MGPGELTYTFELGDTLYAKACIPAGERKVGLWLGAGILLEYELADACQFLDMKRTERKEELVKCAHDLDFIRRQITTTEVTVARLYNHVVRHSRPHK